MAAINHPLGRSRRLPGVPGWRGPTARVNWWVLGAIGLLGMSAMLPVIQSSSATSRGYQIGELQDERDSLLGEIALLESDVATLTSLDRVQQRAAEIGLKPATSTHFVSVDVAGPEPAKLPAEYLPDPSLQPGGTESWWRSLLRSLPLLPD